jgi:hypothetical protein
MSLSAVHSPEILSLSAMHSPEILSQSAVHRLEILSLSAIHSLEILSLLTMRSLEILSWTAVHSPKMSLSAVHSPKICHYQPCTHLKYCQQCNGECVKIACRSSILKVPSTNRHIMHQRTFILAPASLLHKSDSQQMLYQSVWLTEYMTEI